MAARGPLPTGGSVREDGTGPSAPQPETGVFGPSATRTCSRVLTYENTEKYIKTGRNSYSMALFEFGLSCIALVVVIVIIAIIFIFVLEFVVEFLPALIVAGVVYWYTDGDVLWTIVAFVVSAIVFAGLGQTRRRRVRD